MPLVCVCVFTNEREKSFAINMTSFSLFFSVNTTQKVQFRFVRQFYIQQ